MNQETRMNNTLITASSLTLSSLLVFGCQSKKDTKELPNIIYILADDMGYGDISALNENSKIQTPTLDNMVQQGVSFTNAHSNASVSSPTRYGTLTGRYSFRTRLKAGVLVGYSPALIEPNRKTVGNLLQEQGYQTACIGKWHVGVDWQKKEEDKPLFEGTDWDVRNTNNVDYSSKVGGGPDERGFDYSYILPASLGQAPYMYLENGIPTSLNISHIDDWSSTKARGMRYRKGDCADNFNHHTCLQEFTNKSLEYIEEASQKEDPFFLYFALTAPHTPWLPSDEFVNSSEAGYYGDFVVMVDDVVKQVYEKLEECGVEENTIVIFTSDNGSHWLASDIEKYQHQSNGKFAGMKSDLLEGGHHVPYLVTWPKKIKEGRTSHQLVSSTDLMATLADMLNVPLDENMGEDSFSFWYEVSLQASNQPRRSSMVLHSDKGYFGLTKGDYVLLDCKGSGGWSIPEEELKELPDMQLYNLKEDIHQENNLITSLPKVAEQMKLELDFIKQQL